MKVVPLIAVSAVVGGAIGAAMAYVSVGDAVDVAVVDSPVEPRAAAAPSAAAGLPKARVDNDDYDFGVMQRGSTRSHAFKVFNDGDASMFLRVGSSSCKCTVGEVEGGAIPPGDAALVTLKWTATTSLGPFRQTANLHATPGNSTLVLTVSGEVVDVTGLIPRDFNLGRIGVDEAGKASVVLMAFDSDRLEVTAEPPANEELAGAFTTEVTRLKPSELPDRRASDGVRVDLTAAPGLPIGAIEEVVTLKTNLAEAESLIVPVLGRVEGALTIRGMSWSPDSGVLALGTIKSSVGKTEKLRVMIKGPKGGDANLTVAEVDPPEMRVTLGGLKQVNEELHLAPLTIEVPAGTRSMIRLNTGRRPDGAYQHPEGVIRLTSDLPNTPEIKLRVRLAVEGDGR